MMPALNKRAIPMCNETASRRPALWAGPPVPAGFGYGRAKRLPYLRFQSCSRVQEGGGGLRRTHSGANRGMRAPTGSNRLSCSQ